MRNLLLLPLMFGSIVACSGTTATGSGVDPNSPVAHAVDTLTTVLFNTEQPAVNAAVASLPPDAQALAQAAYVALEEAVKAAEGAVFRVLTVDANNVPHNVSNDLASIAKLLSDTIHDPNVSLILTSP